MRSVAWISNAVLRLSGRRAGAVIVYHRIGGAERGWDPRRVSPPMATRLFEQHLLHLKRRYRVVPPSELLEAVRNRRRGERFPVAVTFDDDLASHVREAMPILTRMDVPATFFVCGASLDRPFTFWWERLVRAQDRGRLDEAQLRSLVPAVVGATRARDSRGVRALATDIEFMDPDDRDALSELLGERAGPDPPDAGLRRDDLRALTAAGFEVGFHTLRHYNLAVLADGRLEQAMHEGRVEVAAVVGHELSSIAYPGGKWSDEVVAAARAAGFRLGFTTDPEPVLPNSDPLCFGRFDPEWCITIGHFALAVARVLRRSPSRAKIELAEPSA
jgi:peptidoglycan/xylan/chitin deacetylase (PgdA/CDA1 family)